jgi:hypothetical protein
MKWFGQHDLSLMKTGAQMTALGIDMTFGKGEAIKGLDNS